MPYGYQLYIQTFEQLIKARREITQIKIEEEPMEYLFNVYNEEKKE